MAGFSPFELETSMSAQNDNANSILESLVR